MNLLKGIFFLILLAAVIGFAIKNDQPVSLNYFGQESLPLPIFLWAFFSFFLGLVIAGCIAFISKIGLRSRIRQQQKAITDLERKRNALITGGSLP